MLQKTRNILSEIFEFQRFENLKISSISTRETNVKLQKNHSNNVVIFPF